METKGVEKIDSVNPTASVFREYLPNQRAKAKVADNITTLDKTSRKSANEIVTIYRGAPSNQKAIVAGDFVTTNKQLAKDYAGNGIVLEKKVKMSDVLDDINEPLGEEYIYKPKINIPEKEENLEQEAKKYKNAEEFVKNQTVIYHGTPERFTKFNTDISEGNATWFSESTKDILSGEAGAVQKTGQKLNIMERYIKPDIKLATPEMADKMYTDQLIAEGYRGVKYPAGEYGDYAWTKLFNPNEDTLTKSQLTDIWNEANKTPELKFE